MLRKTALALMTAALLFSTAACGSSSAASTETSGTETSATETSGMEVTTIIGQVTEISSDTITLALGTYNMPSDMSIPDGDGTTSGEQPEAADTAAPGDMAIPDNMDESGNLDEDGSAPVMPSGDMDGQGMPNGGDMQPGDGGLNGGGPGNMNGGGSFGFTANGETQTITITSETVITIKSSDTEATGTISDIAVDDILTVTLSGTTVTEIIVSQFSGGMSGEAPENAPNGEPRDDLGTNIETATGDEVSSAT